MDLNVLLLDNSNLFTEKGLIIDNDFPFHNRNLLIGKNGAGKTRFLKTLESYYKENNSNNFTVLTLYFPEINSKITEEYSIGLYDAIFEKERLANGDFLHLVAQDCISLIDDIYKTMSIQASKTQKRARDDFKRLNKYFKDLFGFELSENKDNNIITMIKTIEGSPNRISPIEETIKEFSPGELMLFYLSILIFYLDHQSDAKLVLIIDEPELHLHPKALMSFMEMIMNSKAISQLWVASHSLFIMPFFPFEQIVYFNQNHICPLNRHTYEHIYNDLVGFENADIYELLRSVENWSHYQFIVESFFLPTSKNTVNKNDEQLKKFLHCLNEIQNERSLNVLDFGAGKFRLWECLKQIITDSNERNKLLTYSAYEPYPCTDIPPDIFFFKNENDLKDNYYDAVVLMNVLHEIDPLKWVDTFRAIKRVLKKNGVLIFLEVISLTNGEQPYGKTGFLLLQEPQVKKLFPNSYSVNTNVGSKQKSNCWIITPEDLSKITFDKVISAISSLESYCENSLKILDDERIKLAQDKKITKKNFKIKMTAREYAFLSQQYINAHFASIRLQKEKEKFTNKTYSTHSNGKSQFPGIIKN